MTTSTSNPILNQSISIFPNPATTQLTITLENSSYSVQSLRVIDISGKVQLQEKWQGDNRQEIDISDLSQGLYFLQLTYEHGQIHNTKLVKK